MSDANLGDGANGRLSESHVADLARHLYDREGFHAADSWATETEINRSRYEALAEAVRDWLPRIVREHTERAWDEGKREGELLAYNAVLAQHAINRRAYANERRRLRDNRPDLYANPYAAQQEQDQ